MRRQAIFNRIWFVASVTLAARALGAAVRNDEPSGLLYVGVNAVTAVLFLLRRDAEPGPGGPAGHAVAVASMLSVYLYRFDREGRLAWLGDSLVLSGAVLCIVATVSLGRSFGVLPARRGIQTDGLYRFIRHPIYLSYVLMDSGAILIAPTPWNAVVFSAACCLLVQRMRLEEDLLAVDVEYAAYLKRVRFRLVPRCY